MNKYNIGIFLGLVGLSMSNFLINTNFIRDKKIDNNIDNTDKKKYIKREYDIVL